MDNFSPDMLFTTNALSNTFMNKFKTNNIALDYMINFMFLGLFGWFTTVAIPKLRVREFFGGVCCVCVCCCCTSA
jgi:hypothetical protein